MERFHLSRYDLMCMSWTQLMMIFDATYEEADERPRSDGVRKATKADYDNWF
jgi:hypothetical protein